MLGQYLQIDYCRLFLLIYAPFMIVLHLTRTYITYVIETALLLLMCQSFEEFLCGFYINEQHNCMTYLCPAHKSVTDVSTVLHLDWQRHDRRHVKWTSMRRVVKWKCEVQSVITPFIIRLGISMEM